MTVIGSPWTQPALDQPLGDERRAAGLVEVGGGVAAARHQVADQRRAAGDGVEVVDRQRDAGLAGQGEQVEHGVGRAAAGGDAGDRVLERLAGQDVAWAGRRG